MAFHPGSTWGRVTAHAVFGKLSDMNAFDYVLDILLVLLVVLQLRPTRFGIRAIALPLVIAGVVGAFYLRGFPLGGNDLALITALTVVGAVIGVASGATTRVWVDALRGLMVRASAAAAVLWIVGMGGRALFQFWADGSGGHAVATFSMNNQITGAAPWVTALVLMALAQVVARTVVLCIRAGALARSRRAVASARIAVAETENVH